MNEQEFGTYLKSLRKSSGLTIRQLEEKSGVSNAYLSQLENGKRGLPSPEILMKIHEPLCVGYDELMEKAGYISKDLLPETIQAIGRASRLSENGLEELLSNAAELFFDSVTYENGVLKEEYKQILLDGSDDKELKELLDDPALTNQLFDQLTIEEKIVFLNILIKDFVERGVEPKEILKKDKLESNSIPILKVPVLGYIAAGQPILAEEHIEEWTEIPNNWHLKEGEAIILKVKGDSMIGSRIFDGDKVVVKLQQDVESGEIAAVNVNGYEATLKRVKKTENGQVILYPDNPNYEPIFIENEGARIIGKVIQVMFEPK